MKDALRQLIESSGFWFWIPALIGGTIDYLNKIHRGDKRWSVGGFVVHLSSALFFGWIAGTLAGGLGYDMNIVAACGGMGGFFGVRMADLIAYRFMKIERRVRKQ